MTHPDMRLVPVEPTDAMLDAARGLIMALSFGAPNHQTSLSEVTRSGFYGELWSHILTDEERAMSGPITKAHRAQLIYRAMLAAAPHQPQPAAEAMTEAEVRQWIDACNHEPARQVLRDYLALRAQQPAQGEAVEVEPKGYWFDPLDPDVTDTNPDSILVAYYSKFEVAVLQYGDLEMFGFWFEPADGSDFQYRYFSDRDQADAEALAQETSVKSNGKPDAWLHRSKTGVGVYLTPGSSKSDVTVQPLYTHPAPSQQSADDKLTKAVEALEPLARLELPKKPVGNAGAYSILHTDIRRAKEALAALKAEGK